MNEKQASEAKKRIVMEEMAGNAREDLWRWGSGKRCRTCMWYVEKHKPLGEEIGRCRRHAPTMSGYPVVFPTDWCGDHKIDENKI